MARATSRPDSKRHAYIKEDDLRLESPEFRQGLFAVIADMDFVPVEPEHLGQAVGGVDVVVGDHHPTGLDDFAGEQARRDGRVGHRRRSHLERKLQGDER